MSLIAVFIVSLMAVWAWLARGLYPSVVWIQAPLPAALFVGMTALAACWVILWPVRHKGRDTAARAWAGIAVAGLLLLTPLTIAKLADAAVNKARDAALSDAMREHRLKVRQRELAERDKVEQDAPRDRFTTYEGRLDAQALLAIRQLDAEMQRTLDAAAERYRAALESAATRGPDEWIQMRSLELLEAELAEHSRLYSATRAFTIAVEQFEPTYLERIDALQLTPPADRVAIAELQRILQLWEAQQALDLRRLDERLLAAAIRVLNVLRESWGEWRFSPRDQSLTFDNPPADQAFQEAMADLIEANQAVNAIRDAQTSQNDGL